MGQNLEAPQLFRVSLSAVKRDQERGRPGGRAGASVELLGLQCRMVKEAA